MKMKQLQNSSIASLQANIHDSLNVTE